LRPHLTGPTKSDDRGSVQFRAVCDTMVTLQ
jgi:hypothetical protein